jgi:cytochrome c oxidase assembly factor CtaG
MPLVATVLHGVAIWAWHVPALFAAALRSESVHWAQHLSFLITALLFWWAVLQRAPRERAFGAALFALFITAMHTGFLGVLLTFAPRPLLLGQSAASEWGLSDLEDQQLAGLIMWVPGSGAYVLAALVLAAAWISSSGISTFTSDSEDPVATT